MPVLDTSIFKERADILSQMLTALQDAVPSVYIGEDGVLRIIFEIESGQLESAYLAAQLVLEDVFPQTASAPALKLHGDTFNLPFLTGDYADGILKFTGAGGTLIPSGSQAGADPGNGNDLFAFVTTVDATIPDPGTPTAPTAAVSATAGNLNGTYEYVVTFLTLEGETVQSVDSNAVAPVNKVVDLTAIPLGGAGTTKRRIYRQKNGTGPYLLVTEINNNTATTYSDNITDAATGPTTPPGVGTATAVSVTAVAAQAGIDYNVAPGTIVQLMTVPAAITAVTNPAAFTGGTNQEDVEHYRDRLLTYLRNPRTGSEADLKFWAETIPGVESATVFSNDNLGIPTFGHTTVRIVGPGGIVPDSSVVAAVKQELEIKDVANITIHVGTFTSTTLPISVQVTLAEGYVLADVEADVKQAVSDYVSSTPVGGTVYSSGVIDAVFGLPGIIDVKTSLMNTTAAPIQKYSTGLNDVTVS